MEDLTGAVPGRTPLSFEDQEGLLQVALTRAAVDALEAENIAAAVAWLSRRRSRDPVALLDEGFVRALHRRMFGDVWSWAGTFRRSDTDLGVPWPQIPVALRRALDDARAWIDTGIPPDEAAVRLGHRVVSVHPFPNGNSRLSRLLSDQLAVTLGRPPFAWGPGGADPAARRAAYLAALRDADAGDIDPLVAFARG